MFCKYHYAKMDPSISNKLALERKIRWLAKITRQELTGFIQNTECFNSKNWKRSCLVCSWLLERVYKAHGVDSKLCIGIWKYASHAFVMIGDNVIDITGTQFKLPKVHIEQLKNSHYKVISSNIETHKDYNNWPCNQTPEHYKDKLENIFKVIIEKTK